MIGTTPACVWGDRFRGALEGQQRELLGAKTVLETPLPLGDPYAADLRIRRYHAAIQAAQAYLDYAVQAEQCFRDAAEHEMATAVTA